MRMIEFSQENVTADKKETALQLLFLFCFALCAASYVLKRGLEDPERPTYKVLLKCVLILTQVVPPSLPMQMAFAVHTALMSLMRSGIYCTEPFRVPEAGKIEFCFFDKTGTLTSDQMHGTGLVLALPNGDLPKELEAYESQRKSGLSSENPLSRDYKKEVKGDTILGMKEHDNHVAAFVIGGCHAMIEVNEKLCGDPIEIAGIIFLFFLDCLELSLVSDSKS